MGFRCPLPSFSASLRLCWFLLCLGTVWYALASLVFFQAQLHFFVDGVRKSLQDLASTSVAQFLFSSVFASFWAVTPETLAPETPVMPALNDFSAGNAKEPEPAGGGVWLDILGFLGRAASQHRPLIAAAGPGTSIMAAVLLSLLARRGA